MGDAHARRYVERHFWQLDELADAVGIVPKRVDELIAAKCAPSAIYVQNDEGWWSALERRKRPMPEGTRWHSPSAAWNLREALIQTRNGATDSDAAAAAERLFTREFRVALENTNGARLAYPQCFSEGSVDHHQVLRTARDEWAAWLGGGYGVCLRIFTADTCVAKEALSAAIRAALNSESYDTGAVLAQARSLSLLILPFAPWERLAGTPGQTLDRLLANECLGSDQPYLRL